MQFGLIIVKQVSGFVGGERDYSNLKGDTGPLVYPAGFLYVYSAIQYVTGGEVYPAQVIYFTLVSFLFFLGVSYKIWQVTSIYDWWV